MEIFISLRKILFYLKKKRYMSTFYLINKRKFAGDVAAVHRRARSFVPQREDHRRVPR